MNTQLCSCALSRNKTTKEFDPSDIPCMLRRALPPIL
jgi:hypothetical protein